MPPFFAPLAKELAANSLPPGISYTDVAALHNPRARFPAAAAHSIINRNPLVLRSKSTIHRRLELPRAGAYKADCVRGIDRESAGTAMRR
jgi:hypothetical protein